MKVKVFSILGVFALLAGCVSTQTGGGGASAAQTATDLVRALGGASKARAESNMVTLTGDVWVEKSLLVPAGVTLDVTRDGARLFLKDGVTLTVNGTVNARGHGDHGNGWVDGGLLIDDGTIDINGNGTISLKSKGQLLHIWGGNGKRQLILDGVTLVGVEDNNESLVGVYEGGELVLKSGVITGNSSKEGGGVKIGVGGSFTMSGGEIMGNTATGNGGGGVFIERENSIFIMEGGAISGNTATGNGGGIVLASNESKDVSKFIMKGGVIFGNTSGWLGGGVSFIGGDPRENENVHHATFIMEGGRIQGSTVSDGFAANTASRDGAALRSMYPSNTYWGTGGTYTKGGVFQTGGSLILGNFGIANDTLIAIPAQ